MKDIFSEAGPVLSFKLVYDRESGKPKGYGFCEYRDQETAQSAMRNLNQYELNGRSLRVDNATNERFKEEIKNLQIGLSGSFESPYGPEMDSDKAPEQISKVVSSLPPEQMFEIAKQMKHCVLTNPNEARNMLLQNPQLAYALLQMLVVMKAVDVNTASSILYKPNPVPVMIPHGNPVPGFIPQQQIPNHMVMPQPQAQQQPPPLMSAMHQNMYDPHDYSRGPLPPQPGPQNFDQRHLDPRLRQNDNRASEIYDPRLASANQTASGGTPAPMDPRLRGQAFDPRHLPQQPTNTPIQQTIIRPNVVPSVSTTQAPIDPRITNQQQQPIFNKQNFVGQPVSSSTASGNTPTPVCAPTQQVPASQPAQVSSTTQPSQASMNQTEAEKAQLIMQVLSLTEHQINMLPADQRQSILALRQQFQQQNK